MASNAFIKSKLRAIHQSTRVHHWDILAQTFGTEKAFNLSISWTMNNLKPQWAGENLKDLRKLAQVRFYSNRAHFTSTVNFLNFIIPCPGALGAWGTYWVFVTNFALIVEIPLIHCLLYQTEINLSFFAFVSFWMIACEWFFMVIYFILLHLNCWIFRSYW